MKNILSKFVSKLPILYKIIALPVTIVLVLVLFPQQKQATHYDYSVGSIWNEGDLYAPFDFSVQHSQELIDENMSKAKAEATLYYSEDSSAYMSACNRLRQYAKNNKLSANEERRLKLTLDSIYSIGYISTPENMPNFETHTIILIHGNVGSERKVNDFVKRADIENKVLADSILVENIVFDAARTQLELDAWLSQSGFTAEMIMNGELIIAKGEPVSKENAEIIASLEREMDTRFSSQYNVWGHYAGNFMLCLIAFMALYMFMKITRHKILEDNRKVTFVLLTVLIMVAATALVVKLSPEWVLVVPLCIAPVLMRVFFDMRVALYIHLATVIILGNMVPNSFEFIFYQLVTGMVSIISVRNFERRSNFFTVCGVIFLTYSFIYTGGMLSQETTLAHLNPDRYLMFFINALLTLLAYPLIYLFERMFGMVTDLTLMEISSTSSPALRELSRKAPGTFQHSMQVANISEDLVSELGGNALLAKVGALYHDIGKLNAPLYFTENQNSDFNPHDELEYEDSARIITHHVVDGIDLARKYKLPGCVIDFIRTHHGTTFTGYFFAKQKEAHPDEEVDISAFRYAGPTPFSKETAIVMIVDSVEAACKSLKNHDKESINNLIDKIVDGKIREHQLNNCDLTFNDITFIKHMLKEKMPSIYHVRISYPVTATTSEEKPQ